MGRGSKGRRAGVEQANRFGEKRSGWLTRKGDGGPPAAARLSASTIVLLQLNILQTVVFSDHNPPRPPRPVVITHTQCARDYRVELSAVSRQLSEKILRAESCELQSSASSF